MEALSLRDTAYQEIKHRIITLAYRPGEYLNEARISESLDIGRTPVHQALDRLMIEGMLEVIPRKGVIVRPVSLEEVSDLLEARLITEPRCAALAAERATEEDIGSLSTTIQDADVKAEEGNIEAVMMLDRDFHAGIAAAAKNIVLADIIMSLQERILRLWFISLSDGKHAQRVQGEHRDVLDGIIRREPEQAAAAMKAHIESFRQNISRSI